ncbi:hypothetical protein [Inquilinus sp. CA228]|uniref:hypothetical protein n=1 Tax=Inquilinus sp. CA228 TaxID=3455609 RepID=UPI003F8CFE79
MVDPSVAMPDRGIGDFRVGDAFSRSFEIFSRHFVAFLVLALLSNLPVFLYLFVLTQGVGAGNPGMAAGISGFLGFLGSLIANGAIIYGVVQTLRNQSFSVGRCLTIGLSALIPILGVSITVGVLVMLGMILLIVPGIMVFCAYYVAVPAAVVERPGVFASLSRSGVLTKGHRWRIFGILVVVVIASAAVQALAEVILGTMGLYAAVFGPLALTSIVSAFGAVVNGVVYYQLRVAKEGVDIEEIARVFD